MFIEVDEAPNPKAFNEVDCTFANSFIVAVGFEQASISWSVTMWANPFSFSAIPRTSESNSSPRNSLYSFWNTGECMQMESQGCDMLKWAATSPSFIVGLAMI